MKSVFQGRAPTAFFEYPNYVCCKRKSNRKNIYSGEALEHLFISYAFDTGMDYNSAVINTCKFAGFSETMITNPYFNVIFTRSYKEEYNLNKFQKVNQFPCGV